MTAPLSEEALAAVEHRLGQVLAVAPPPWQGWLETEGGLGGESFVQFLGDPHVDNEMYVVVVLGGERLHSPDPRLDRVVDFVGNAVQDIQRLIAEVRRLRGTPAH